MKLNNTRPIDAIAEEYALLFPNDNSYFHAYLNLLNSSATKSVTREEVLSFVYGEEDAELDADYEAYLRAQKICA